MNIPFYLRKSNQIPYFYERRTVPFSVSNTTIDQIINEIISHLNETIRQTNDTIRNWNDLVDWLIKNGYKDYLAELLQDYIDNGAFDEIIKDIAITNVDGGLF